MKVLVSSLCIDDDRFQVDCCAGVSTKSTPNHGLHDWPQYRGDRKRASMGRELWGKGPINANYMGKSGFFAPKSAGEWDVKLNVYFTISKTVDFKIE